MPATVGRAATQDFSTIMLKMLGLDRLASLVSRKVLYLWVRTKVFPQDLSALNLNPDQPVCYVLQTRQLSPLLVLENETQALKLPRALSRMKGGALKEDRSFFFLTRAEKPTLLQRNRFETSPRLKRLMEAVQATPGLDVQLVPVTILWGRSPDKENSLVKILFTDSWATPGMLKQLFTVMLHGRQTIVKFNDPVSLRALVDENLGEERTLRKLSRVLRVHFRRQREMSIGPDLSHRRTQVNSLLSSTSVERAIADDALAGEEGVSEYADYRGRSVTGADYIVKETQWGLIREEDTSEILASVTQLRNVTLALAGDTNAIVKNGGWINADSSIAPKAITRRFGPEAPLSRGCCSLRRERFLSISKTFSL